MLPVKLAPARQLVTSLAVNKSAPFMERVQAINCLGVHGNPKALIPLIICARDQDRGIKDWAEYWIKGLQKEKEITTQQYSDLEGAVTSGDYEKVTKLLSQIKVHATDYAIDGLLMPSSISLLLEPIYEKKLIKDFESGKVVCDKKITDLIKDSETNNVKALFIGPPGTGKTSIAYHLIGALAKKSSSAVIVEIKLHSMNDNQFPGLMLINSLLPSESPYDRVKNTVSKVEDGLAAYSQIAKLQGKRLIVIFDDISLPDDLAVRTECLKFISSLKENKGFDLFLTSNHTIDDFSNDLKTITHEFGIPSVDVQARISAKSLLALKGKSLIIQTQNNIPLDIKFGVFRKNRQLEGLIDFIKQARERFVTTTTKHESIEVTFDESIAAALSNKDVKEQEDILTSILIKEVFNGSPFLLNVRDVQIGIDGIAALIYSSPERKITISLIKTALLNIAKQC